MPVDWYTVCAPDAASYPADPPGPGRPHRDRRKINASRRAARRNRRK